MKKWCSPLLLLLLLLEEEEEAASKFAFQLSTVSALPAALRCAVELDLLELIKKAGLVSAAELAAQIAVANPRAHLMIDWILYLLAANNILHCSGGGGGAAERLYSLAPVCNFLTMNEDGVPLFLMNHNSIFMECWYHLNDVVLEGGVPFERAYGMRGFEFQATDARVNKMFNLVMSKHSTIIMWKILREYKGFEGVKCLVDVGGGVGASLKMIIMSEYPLIKAINFDLPHVIQLAPPQKGVEHVRGDMFVSVPRGDAIFMKSICHDWSDGECLRVLRNCHEALPNGGKLVIVERIVSEITEKDTIYLAFDVIMLAYYGSGKERTEVEIRALAKASGFKEFKKAGCAMGFWIMEFYK